MSQESSAANVEVKDGADPTDVAVVVDDYKEGAYVELQGTKKKDNTRRGFIRFKGKIKNFGECVGVELDADDTKKGGNNGDEKNNDGTFDGKQYFECNTGRGTFIKTTKIVKLLPAPVSDNAQSLSAPDPLSPESFPASPGLIEKSESDQIKPHKKKKKKKKKSNASSSASLNSANKKDKEKDSVKKGSKSAKKASSSSGKRLSAKATTPKRLSGSLSKKSSKSISKKKTKKEVNFAIPSSGTQKEKLQFVFDRLADSKSSVKKRVELMQKSLPLIEEEKTDSATAKFMVDAFKKCFVAQLNDRKKSAHVAACAMLDAMIVHQKKAFKSQVAHYLKHLIQTMEKADPKTSSHIEATIERIVTECTIKDNKCLGIVTAELIRFGSSAKNKTVRKHSWAFIGLILRRYEPRRSSVVAAEEPKKKAKNKKPPKVVMDALQTGLKQGLADSDKATQKEALMVLQSISLIDEQRAERISARLSPAARRHFDKLTGRSGARKGSDSLNKIKKVSSKRLLKEKKTSKKVNSKKEKVKEKEKTSPKKGKGAKGKKVSVKEKEKDSKKKGTKKGAKRKKSKSNANTPKVETEDTVEEITAKKAESTESVKDEAAESNGISESTTTEADLNAATEAEAKETDDAGAGVSDASEPGQDVDAGGDAGATAEEEEPELSALEMLQIENETANLEKVTQEGPPSVETSSSSVEIHEDDIEQELDDENDEDEDSDSDSDSDSDEGGGMMDGQSSEDDARELIESFLDLKDPQINWKMIEFLSKDNMTHLLMSYISRMPQGPKIWQENLEVDLDLTIGPTLPLFSDEADEIRATQLSYSLMRILSNEQAAETVKSFLLRKCQEICLHALAVFHPLSKGNVYHGRVVLEILLNHWPKSFMAALANQRHIQTLLKCALFRNLHQGNLNSFFLDLICFRAQQQKLGQIQPVKAKLMQMFVDWKFMPYLLDAASSPKHGDDVATKYATFFIDMVARCASIQEATLLFANHQHLIVDSLMRGLLDADESRSTWQRISCGQTLVQFLDISSRPTIMDPASAMAGMLGVMAPEPSPNILHPLFDDALSRLHSFMPQMCAVITNGVALPPMRLASGEVPSPFGQVRLNCLELLTVSADFAQFKCGHVLSLLTMHFWASLLDLTFAHPTNNMYLCHFRRLVHLSVIFRRRFLKHLFVECQMLERFVDFYQNKPHPRVTMHGYVLQMLWDISTHDQRDEDDDEDDSEDEEDGDGDDGDDGQRDSVVVNADGDGDENKAMAPIMTGGDNDSSDDAADGDADGDAEEEEEFGDDMVLKPNFSKEAEDQWDILAFFNGSSVWQAFQATVALQMEAQSPPGGDSAVPNQGVANNQEQLDQLLQNLLGPTEENSDSTDSDSDSDED